MRRMSMNVPQQFQTLWRKRGHHRFQAKEG
jgi:hypothetical protein